MTSSSYESSSNTPTGMNDGDFLKATLCCGTDSCLIDGRDTGMKAEKGRFIKYRPARHVDGFFALIDGSEGCSSPRW